MEKVMVVVMALMAVVIVFQYRKNRKLRLIEKTLKEQIKITTEELETLKSQNQILEVHALVDSLTGIGNRRYAEKMMDREVSLAKRNCMPISVIYLDADNLRVVNNTHGHAKGDEYLAKFAKALQDSAGRKHDIIARLGGDEFIIILPCVGLAGAMKVANEAADKIRRIGNEIDIESRTTASVGIASIDDWSIFKEINSDEVIKKITERADAAMYEAKANGRDCIMVADLTAA